MRAAFIIICAVVSGVAAYSGQPMLKDNPDAITIIVTVITVFAGFLVAIIAVLGDPSIVPEGSWTKAEVARENLDNSLARNVSLFYIYLLAIGFLFAGVLVNKSGAAQWIKQGVECAYLFFGVFSFLLTLSLPNALGKLQKARADALVEERRRKAGIKTSNEHEDGL